MATPTGEVTSLDPAVLKELPEGCSVISLQEHGNSVHAYTTKVVVRKSDGVEQAYFIKFIWTNDAAARVLGEFEVMLEHYSITPHFVPRPHAYGRCLHAPEKHFVIFDFLNLAPGVKPNPVKLAAILGAHHQRSCSPDGKFGFRVTTFDGKLPVANEWSDDWVSFFTRLVLDVYRHDVAYNGLDVGLDTLVNKAASHVIPRLLGALGPNIKPSLIHSDLWETNIGVDPDSGNIYIYDSCGYYAHRELELGIWRPPRGMGFGGYREEYFRQFPPDEPSDEAEDRNRLYSMYANLMNSAHFGNTKYRRALHENLQYLVDKFGPHEREPSPSHEALITEAELEGVVAVNVTVA